MIRLQEFWDDQESSKHENKQKMGRNPTSSLPVQLLACSAITTWISLSIQEITRTHIDDFSEPSFRDDFDDLISPMEIESLARKHF